MHAIIEQFDFSSLTTQFEAFFSEYQVRIKNEYNYWHDLGQAEYDALAAYMDEFEARSIIKVGASRPIFLKNPKITKYVIFNHSPRRKIQKAYNLRGAACVSVPPFVPRVLKVGGNYGNGLSAGLLARNANNASSNANANNGGRLLVQALFSIAHALPRRLAKILP